MVSFLQYLKSNTHKWNDISKTIICIFLTIFKEILVYFIYMWCYIIKNSKLLLINAENWILSEDMPNINYVQKL